MPCDSAAAGIIALGALIRDLGNPQASDLHGHYEALLSYAWQYLKHCRTCNTRCQPQLRGCGFETEAFGWLRKGRKKFQISCYTDLEQRRLVLSIPAGSWTIFPQSAIDLRIDSDPPLQLAEGASGSLGDAYASIIDNARIFSDNLRRSYSGLCFAGRIAGEAAAREMCTAIRFRCSDGIRYLSDLLTVYGWSSSNSVSRMTFFNARSEQFDRSAPAPQLVVADGHASFLKCLKHPRFQRADVIGAMQRTVDRESLEAVGSRVNQLRQWYDEDLDAVRSLGSVPNGMSVLILKKRGT